MIKKLILFFLILIVLYGISVFTHPQIAGTIDTLLGMPGLSDNLRGKKAQVDTVITDIPNVDEVRSGALDLRQKIQGGVTTTKETIDSIRSGAQKVEDTYNDARDTYNELRDTLSGAQDMIHGATQKIGEVQGMIESVSELTGTPPPSGDISLSGSSIGE